MQEVQRDTISKEIFDRILSHHSSKGKKPESIRRLISYIHEKNNGLTMNAAAYKYAKDRNLKVYRYLSDDDRRSLQFLKSDEIAKFDRMVNETSKRQRIRKVSFENDFSEEAISNANIYPYVYIIENCLRYLMLSELGEDDLWWKDTNIVKQEIQQYAERIRQAEQKYPWVSERAKHPVYYVGLNELFQIIDKNWSSFRDALVDLEQLRSWIKEVIPVRNLIAHNVKVKKSFEINTKLKSEFIYAIFEKWKSKQS